MRQGEKRRASARTSGAYALHVCLSREVTIHLNRCVGRVRLAPGRYVYFGSARAGIGQRIAHHVAVDRGRRPARHWHIDRLLELRPVSIRRAFAYPGGDECDLCRSRMRRGGATVPVEGFGASDCRRGCGAHLLRLSVNGETNRCL